eukprot:SAG22_NODE_1022_length_5991_cov_3.875424_1_plen_55_part_10
MQQRSDNEERQRERKHWQNGSTVLSGAPAAPRGRGGEGAPGPPRGRTGAAPAPPP